MNTKLFVLVLAILGAAQAAKISQTNLEALGYPIDKPIIEKLIELLNSFSTGTTELASVLKTLDFSNKALAKLVSDMAIAGNQLFLDILKNMEDGTPKTGKILLECLEAQNATVEKYLVSFGQELRGCVNLDGIQWYLQEYVKDLDWSSGIFKNYTSDLKECEDDLLIICIPKVIEKNHGLPQLVLVVVDRVLQDLIGLAIGSQVVLDLISCGSNSISSHLSDCIQVIFNDVVNCIEQRS